MRIIAGTLGGRIFNSPKGNATHPMSDKVRGALYNSLGDIQNMTVLDVFGGTGALSFEAISRGASMAIIIESDKSAQNIIALNTELLKLKDQVKLIRARINGWLQNNPDGSFDIVIADPPYDNPQSELLERLAERVKLGGMYVLSWPGKTVLPNIAGVEKISQKQYGDAQLIFYRRIA